MESPNNTKCARNFAIFAHTQQQQQPQQPASKSVGGKVQVKMQEAFTLYLTPSAKKQLRTNKCNNNKLFWLLAAARGRRDNGGVLQSSSKTPLLYMNYDKNTIFAHDFQ